jgi:hypothetical protein
VRLSSDSILNMQWGRLRIPRVHVDVQR